MEFSSKDKGTVTSEWQNVSANGVITTGTNIYNFTYTYKNPKVTINIKETSVTLEGTVSGKTFTTLSADGDAVVVFTMQ